MDYNASSEHQHCAESYRHWHCSHGVRQVHQGCEEPELSNILINVWCPYQSSALGCHSCQKVTKRGQSIPKHFFARRLSNTRSSTCGAPVQFLADGEE